VPVDKTPDAPAPSTASEHEETCPEWGTTPEWRAQHYTDPCNCKKPAPPASTASECALACPSSWDGHWAAWHLAEHACADPRMKRERCQYAHNYKTLQHVDGFVSACLSCGFVVSPAPPASTASDPVVELDSPDFVPESAKELAARDFKRINRDAPPADAGARMTEEAFEAHAEHYGHWPIVAEARRARTAEGDRLETWKNTERVCKEFSDAKRRAEATRDALASRVAALTEALREIAADYDDAHAAAIARCALDAGRKEE
jgi:hypothetical protein